jgi:hypothetical protein
LYGSGETEVAHLVKPCRQEWASGGLKSSPIKQKRPGVFSNGVYM